jgi:hypothetical protein
MKRMKTLSKVNIEKAKNLVLEALYIDGSHHKQWYLEEIGRILGIDIKFEYEKTEWERGKEP